MSTRFGRYELLRPLGRGGMAEVFLARYVGPEGFEKRLVIKRILPQWSDDKRLLRMFFEEARTQVSLSQSNLVSVFDFGRVGNDYFIAMEHVHGADLSTLLAAERAAGRPLSPSLTAYIGVELCRALAYVHRRGLVHRDLSPRNVLLSVDGEVKLSDFGLVIAHAAEVAGGVRGTLGYMPPEQARGDLVDGRADLYALAMVLAESVRGERVRHAIGDDEALAAARAGEVVRVDGPLAEVIARATQSAPADRYASADEMLAAIDSAMRATAATGEGREAQVRQLAARVSELAAVAQLTEAEAAQPPSAAPPAQTVTGVSVSSRDLLSNVKKSLPSPASFTAPVSARSSAGAPASAGPSTNADGSARSSTNASAGTFAGRPAHVPSAVPPQGAPPAPPVESYFRDRESASFVDEVLAPPTAATPPPRPRRALAIAGASLFAVAVTIAAVRWSAAPPDKRIPTASGPPPAASATPPPSPQPTQPSRAPASPASASAARLVTATPAVTTPPLPIKSATVAARRSIPALDGGKIVIQCTPWCIPYVDDIPRAEDGRHHTLDLPLGRHRIEVRRLDDHLERTITVRPGPAQTLEFKFD